MVNQSHGIGAPNEHKESGVFVLDDLGSLVADSGKMIWNVFFGQEQPYQPELLEDDEIEDSTVDESILSSLASDLEDCDDKEEDEQIVTPQQSLSSDVWDDGKERDRYAVNYPSLASMKGHSKSRTVREIVHENKPVKNKVLVSKPNLPNESTMVKHNAPASEPILPKENKLVKNKVAASDPILPSESNLANDNTPASKPILQNDSKLVKNKVVASDPILPSESILAKDITPASKPILQNDSKLVKNKVVTSDPIVPSESNLAKDNTPASKPILQNDSKSVENKVTASEPVSVKVESPSMVPPSTPAEVTDANTTLAMGLSCDQSTEKEDHQNDYLAKCSPLVSALSDESDSAFGHDDTQNKSLSEINDVVERTSVDFVPQERDSMAHSSASKSAKRTLNPFSFVTRLKKRESVAVERRSALLGASLLKATPEHPPKSQTNVVDKRLKQKQKQKEKAVTLFTPAEKRGRKKSNIATTHTTSNGKGKHQSPKLFRELLQPDTMKGTARNEGREGMEDSRAIPSKWVAFEKRE